MTLPPALRLSLLLPLILAGCADQSTALKPEAPALRSFVPPQEQAVTLIPLTGEIASKKAQLSGLAWYKDTLLLLPQFPDFGGGEGDGRLFAIPKAEILAFIDGKTSALTPREIPFYGSGIIDEIKDNQGFEAIAVNGEQVYLTIETGPPSMMGYLVTGTLKPDLSELRLDNKTLIELPAQAKIRNAAYEALVIHKDKLISLYEGNGKTLNPKPTARVFNLPALQAQPDIPAPSIEYRITDATPADNDGKFWAVNYFYPGDREFYQTATDELQIEYGRGATHAKLPQVERLLELQYTGKDIHLTDTAPLQLRLEGKEARNWEGIARLDERGFLIVTDRYPETLLGFVAKPKP